MAVFFFSIGKKFSWVDDPLDALPPATAPPPLPIVPDPEDVGPVREDQGVGFNVGTEI